MSSPEVSPEDQAMLREIAERVHGQMQYESYVVRVVSRSLSATNIKQFVDVCDSSDMAKFGPYEIIFDLHDKGDGYIPLSTGATWQIKEVTKQKVRDSWEAKYEPHPTLPAIYVSKAGHLVVQGVTSHNSYRIEVKEIPGFLKLLTEPQAALMERLINEAAQG
ncbi:hypothetical protein BH11PAT4_BH11PAT4_1780 [soil metagenome]